MKESLKNSSNKPLNSRQIFKGEAERDKEYQRVKISVDTDKKGFLTLGLSHDGEEYENKSYNHDGSNILQVLEDKNDQYVQVSFKNISDETQTYFNLKTEYEAIRKVIDDPESDVQKVETDDEESISSNVEVRRQDYEEESETDNSFVEDFKELSVQEEVEEEKEEKEEKKELKEIVQPVEEVKEEPKEEPKEKEEIVEVIEYIENSGELSDDDEDKDVYNEVITTYLNPIVNASAHNNTLVKMEGLTVGSGKVSINNGNYSISTGNIAKSIAQMCSERHLQNKSGQGAVARFSAIFSKGVEKSLQGAGLLNTNNSLMWGYYGSDFGIIYQSGGAVEIREIEVLEAPRKKECVSFIMNDENHTFELEPSNNLISTCDKIVSELNSNISGWYFSQNNNKIRCVSILSGTNGDHFNFMNNTKDGKCNCEWSLISKGKKKDTHFIKRENFNSNKVEWLEPNKGNVYHIKYKYNGYGVINFCVENKEGVPVLAHQMRYNNNNEIPSLNNPSLKIGFYVESKGSTEDLCIKSSSCASFIEGINKITDESLSIHNLQKGVGLKRCNVLTLRNRNEFNGLLNLSEAHIEELCLCSVGTHMPVIVEIIENASSDTPENYEYIDENKSIMEYERSRNIYSSKGEDEKLLRTYIIAPGESKVINFHNTEFVLKPGFRCSITARSLSSSGCQVIASVNWKEDI